MNQEELDKKLADLFKRMVIEDVPEDEQIADYIRRNLKE